MALRMRLAAMSGRAMNAACDPSLRLLDGAPGEFPVAGRDRDPHQLRIVLDIKGEQGEQLQAIWRDRRRKASHGQRQLRS
jgi:hypothetical protein